VIRRMQMAGWASRAFKVVTAAGETAADVGTGGGYSAARMAAGALRGGRRRAKPKAAPEEDQKRPAGWWQRFLASIGLGR